MKRVSAAVVGSGFGGLATAIRLQALGIQTVIFEGRDKPGGRAYVYEDDGHTFDAGPTVITAPGCLEELFAVAGESLSRHVELLPVNPFYRLRWSDGEVFDYVGDERLEEQIGRLYPEDLPGYRAFLEYTAKVFAKGYEELASVPFLRFADMVRVAPELIRLRADRSVYAAVARFVKNEHLRQALSFHSLLVGGNPFESSAIYTLIHQLERRWGVFFPRGGTGALVRALVNLFQRLGGEIRLNSKVEHIRLQPGVGHPRHRVRSGGQEEVFDLVVSNADLHHTYSKLYAGNRPAGHMARRLERLEWSMSLFVLYFGTLRNYPDLAHHTILFGPRYRELLDDIFHGPRVPDDFSLYLHAPTITDVSMAPPGRGTYYVLAPVPHLGKAKVDWDELAPKFADRILASLERVMPDVRRQITTRRWFTPSDFQSELVAYQGSAFSLAPKLTQSAWFRPHNRDPEIPGLYLVGAGTHPGAGLPGVVSSAKATVSVIARDFGFGEERRAS
jgi:phytoene desaturase